MRDDPNESAGFAVTLWCEGPAIHTQEDADRVVAELLAATKPPAGVVVAVVPE